MPGHHRADRTVYLGDLPVGLAHRERPVRGAAHHHAFEDGLAADGRVTHPAWLALAGAAGLLEPALEALDAAARVDELLLAGVEGVAGRADLDVKLGLRGPRLKLVAARAANDGEVVVGMNSGLHF